MKDKLSIVYDMTLRCPWDCPICCMGAKTEQSACRQELSFDQKLEVIDKIAEATQLRDIRVDFSGGEIFTDLRNVEVIEYAARLLGQDRIGISSSGFRIDDEMALRLSQCISECEMTMDTAPGQPYPLRPMGYAIAAAKAAPFLKKHGISTGIQTVLARSNCREDILRNVYKWVCQEGIDCWSLLKFYPSGRGAAYPHEKLDPDQEVWAVRFIQQLDEANPSPDKPKVDFHYTMKGHPKHSDECRCVKKSIGIMPDGSVTSCFWAVDANTGIIAPKFKLGNLREQSLTDIISGAAAKYWLCCSHHCELTAA